MGLIGFGAIGRQVAAGLGAGYRLTKLTRTGDDIASIDALIAAGPQLVVEAAGHQAVTELAPRVLAAGIPVVVCSIGSLADAALLQRLEDLAAQHGARLILPAGAVGGLDYLAAVARLPGTQVSYISRKPPTAWADELAARGLTAADVTAELVLFEGPADEAAVRFPKNLNVAATLALSGIGMRRTQVRVLVDPAAAGNIHEIAIDGPAGSARFSFNNAPSPDNPKTSWVTGLSVIQAVRSYFNDRA